MRASVLALLLVFACGDDGANNLPDAPGAPTLRVEPADVTVTIVDGQAVAQAYTATLIGIDGSMRDVTAETAFSIAPNYGAFTGSTVSVSGQGAGPTPVSAAYEGVGGEATLTVYVRSRVVDPGAPANAVDLFGNATEDPTRAPSVVYPSDTILVPPNLGEFDVHWRNNQAPNNLFEVGMANEYVDIRLYTAGTPASGGFWTVYSPSTWYPIASTRAQLTLTVAGLDTANPATKGTAAAQKVDVTNEDTRGGIYYWSTTTQSVWRYDVGRPDVPPSAFFDQAPSGCVGCHTLSRDGTKILMTLDSGNGRGAIFDVGSKQQLFPTPTASVGWNFATFNSDATKLVNVEHDGTLVLRDLAGTALGAALPTANAGFGSTHPELSPDDTRLVNAEYGSASATYFAYDGAIVIRSFDSSTNTFGTPTVLVPNDPNNQISNWYPSFSPDGQWVIFTRTSSGSYDQESAQTWVIKADGTQPPVQLAAANLPAGNLTNSWARWVPFGQSFGPSNEPMFYLTFSTKREFGVRIPTGGLPQIWMVPFFPARAAQGMDPSAPAFRVPFQDVATANHIAQWTQSIVIQ